MRSIQSAPLKHEEKASCSECNGDGWIRVDPKGQRLPAEYRGPCTVVRCACQVRERINHRISAKYREARLLDFKPAAVESVMAWFSSAQPGLLLHGPAGTGKTYLAAAITRSLLEIGHDAEFYEMAEIYRRVRKSFGADSQVPEADILAAYIRTPWLTLDDFGAGALSDFERRCALEILNGRINEERRTIVTTNLDLDEIREKMDERISSRLSLFTQIKTGGKDRRAAGA